MTYFYHSRFASATLFVFLILTAWRMDAQCMNGPAASVVPFSPQYTQDEEVINTVEPQNRCFIINVLPNKQYTFLSKFQNSQSNGYQGQITISSADGVVPYAWGEGAVDWDSGPISGQVRFYIHNNTCSGTNNFPMRWSFMAYNTPCKPPTDTNISDLTSTSVTLNWTPPAQMVPSNGYQYYVSESPSPPYNYVQFFPTGYSLNSSFTYNFLEPNTTYYWWVRSYCGSSGSYWVEGGN